MGQFGGWREGGGEVESGVIQGGRFTPRPPGQVDTNSRLDSVLALSSVNLPGGELRRRSAEDELSMRRYLQEGDIISAEVGKGCDHVTKMF